LHLCLNIFKFAGQHKARVTKSRLLGFKDADVFEWSYAVFSERYGRGILEGKVKQVILATPEQLAELDDLLSRVKLPDGQEAKWFKAANCESFDEMDSDKVTNIIAYIKSTYINKEGSK